MKICHITTVHPYNDSRILYKECSSLAADGYDVHYIAPNAPEGTVNQVKLHGFKTRDNNRFIRMAVSSFTAYKLAKNIDADVYHFHDPELMIIGLLLRMGGKKVVYDVHEDVPRQILSKPWIPKGIRKTVSAVFEVLENFAARRLSAMVTATPFINKRFEKLGCKAVNVSNYPILTEIFAESNWESKEDCVCYVGSISEHRGIYEIIDAIGQTDYKLLIGGNLPSSIREKATCKEGWKQVEDLGFIDRDEVRRTMSRSCAGLVVLHPIINYVDALPIKMFEYMSAGIPVISSNFPLWADIVEKDHCGVCVDPFDTKEISEQIKWMIEHKEEAKSMGVNGRKAVEEKYNWGTEYVKLDQLYKEL